MRIPILYRDENGNSLSVADLLRSPGAREYWHGYALHPYQESHVIGRKDGKPVFLVTDVGAALDDGDGPYRRAAFKLPGDGPVHELILPIPCTIPLYVGRRGLVRKPSWVDRRGFYIVHQVTRETLAAMDPPGTRSSRVRRLLHLVTAATAWVSGCFSVALPR